MDLIQYNLKENGIKTYLLTKYVDDINIATSLIPGGKELAKEGSKWTLRTSERMKEEDRHRSEELATIEKVRWLGNRLVPGLKLTIDLPELHSNISVQCWTSRYGQTTQEAIQFNVIPSLRRKLPLLWYSMPTVPMGGRPRLLPWQKN